MPTLTVAEIAERLSAAVEGDATGAISGVAGLREAEPADISFLANAKYASLMEATRAGAVLVSRDWTGACDTTLLRVDNPDQSFGDVATWFAAPPVPRMERCACHRSCFRSLPTWETMFPSDRTLLLKTTRRLGREPPSGPDVISAMVYRWERIVCCGSMFRYASIVLLATGP